MKHAQIKFPLFSFWTVQDGDGEGRGEKERQLGGKVGEKDEEGRLRWEGGEEDGKNAYTVGKVGEKDQENNKDGEGRWGKEGQLGEKLERRILRVV